MSNLETRIYSIMWNEILQRVDATNKSLQDPSNDLNTAMAELLSIKEFVQSKQDSFDYFESEGLKI